MDAQPYVSRILDDEGLVGDLEGDAAEQLVGWLVHSAERMAGRPEAALLPGISETLASVEQAAG